MQRYTYIHISIYTYIHKYITSNESVKNCACKIFVRYILVTSLILMNIKKFQRKKYYKF